MNCCATPLDIKETMHLLRLALFFHVSVILYEKQTCTKHRKEVEGTGCTVS